MRLVHCQDGLIQLAFPTRKALTMTMGRPQEYYESGHANLYRQVFTVEEFLETFMTDDGEVEYYDRWVGFNVPGEILDAFFRDFDVTEREDELYRLVHSQIHQGDRYYVIASLEGDGATLDHELVHAHYYLDDDYREAANLLIADVPDDVCRALTASFENLGYAPEVWADEINAYLSTGTPEYMSNRFNLRGIEDVMAPFRALAATKLQAA